MPVTTLSRMNADTGESEIYSRFGGKELFCEKIEEIRIHHRIDNAVREAETIAYEEGVKAAIMSIRNQFSFLD